METFFEDPFPRLICVVHMRFLPKTSDLVLKAHYQWRSLRVFNVVNEYLDNLTYLIKMSFCICFLTP